LERVKYLHIALSNGEFPFLSSLTNAIANPKYKLDTGNHLFITKKNAKNSLYSNHNQKCKVIESEKDEIEIINTYGKDADFIIVHGFQSKMAQVLNISRELDHKIILRTWGHDIVKPSKNPSSYPKTIYRYLLFRLYRRKLRRFFAIGINDHVDKINVEKVLGNDVNTIIMP